MIHYFIIIQVVHDKKRTQIKEKNMKHHDIDKKMKITKIHLAALEKIISLLQN